MLSFFPGRRKKKNRDPQEYIQSTTNLFLREKKENPRWNNQNAIGPTKVQRKQKSAPSKAHRSVKLTGGGKNGRRTFLAPGSIKFGNCYAPGYRHTVRRGWIRACLRAVNLAFNVVISPGLAVYSLALFALFWIRGWHIDRFTRLDNRFTLFK